MLDVGGLNHYYGGSHALRDVTLEASAGVVTAVLGRNGMGKTTLLECLVGLLRPASGRIRFDRRELGRLRPDQRARLGIACVPQGREIFPRLSVEENIRIAMQATGQPGRAVPGEIYETFPVLREFARRRGGDLSGGQQQQLAIAPALADRYLVLQRGEVVCSGLGADMDADGVQSPLAV